MVSRTRKLLVAALVLAVGIGLAWPFHRSGDASPEEAASAPVEQPHRLAGPVELTPLGVPAAPHRAESTWSAEPLNAAAIANLSPAETYVANTPQEMANATGTDSRNSRPAPPPAPPAVPAEFPSQPSAGSSEPVPVYATDAVSPPQPRQTPSSLRIHVVHNGDTLGRLARRYLGDEARALEIFDLNRRVLDNPHLLPIGAELRIPAAD